MESTIKTSSIMVLNGHTSRPEIVGMPDGTKVVFFARISGNEYCAIAVPENQHSRLKESSVSIGEEKKDIQAEILYGCGEEASEIPLNIYPVNAGHKLNEKSGNRWFFRTTKEDQKEITISMQGKSHSFMDRPIGKIFINEIA